MNRACYSAQKWWLNFFWSTLCICLSSMKVGPKKLIGLNFDPAFLLQETELNINVIDFAEVILKYCKKIFEMLLHSVFCAMFLKIWRQNLPLRWPIYDVFLKTMFDNCIHASTLISAVCSRYWTWSFSANWRKFAVERDWTSKISKSVQNWVLFEKVVWFFEKKNLIFFEIDKGGKLAVQCASNVIIS